LAEIRKHKYVTARQLAQVLGISSRAVEKQIAKLKAEGTLKRIGFDKGGQWEVREEH
jgi:ATP-dependent DNA helicase RecG